MSIQDELKQMARDVVSWTYFDQLNPTNGINQMAANKRLDKARELVRVADRLAVDQEELLDTLEDCWGQFAYELPDGKRYAGGLSTLEMIEKILKKHERFR